MGLEIERKFEVTHIACIEYADDKHRIRQGYLNSDIDRTVRIRVVKGEGGYITVKGRNQGCVRQEYEYSIPETDGEEMLLMCDGGFIDKTRYVVPNRDLIVEVDIFYGDNEGLVVAEIEFTEDDNRSTMTEDELRPFLPEWLGKEVTDNDRYFNSSLLKNPFRSW